MTDQDTDAVPRVGEGAPLQNTGSARDILGTEVDTSGADSGAAIGVIDDGAAFDENALLDLRRQLDAPRVEALGELRLEVVVETILSGGSPRRKSVGPPRRAPSSIGKIMLVLVAAALVLGATWAAWKMLSSSLPFDFTLLSRLLKAKLAASH